MNSVGHHSQRVAYAGISVALAVVFLSIGYFLPIASFVPLALCPLCYYIVRDRAGMAAALIAIAAGGILSIILLGFSPIVIIDVMMITPYSVLILFITRLNYDNRRLGVIRGIIVAILWAVMAVFVTVLVQFVFMWEQSSIITGGLFSNVEGNAIYVVIIVLSVFIGLVTDYLFVMIKSTILPRLPQIRR